MSNTNITSKTLADLMRPASLGEIAGQNHLFDDNSPITLMVKKKLVRNMIFFGPPGKDNLVICLVENFLLQVPTQIK